MAVPRLKDIKLRNKLIGGFLIASIVPLILIAWVVSFNTRKAMVNEAFSKLKAVQKIKENQVEAYFQDRLGDIEVYASNTMVITAIEFFGVAFENDGNRTGELWEEWNRELGPRFEQYARVRQYEDLLLVSTLGDVVYSVKKRSDLGKNLFSSDMVETVLGKAYQNAQESTAFTDFEWYDIDKKPAAFISTPILNEDGMFTGILIFQISVESINQMMQERSGMGVTGETYLVGADHRMRSDSFNDPVGHSVFSSFKDSTKANLVRTVACERALKGEDGHDLIKDYRGNRVFSCYAPIKLPSGISWAILAEIGESELISPIEGLIRRIFLTGIIIALIMGAAGLWLAGQIAHPMIKVIGMIRAMAQGEGDLTRRIEIDSKDETGELAKWFDLFLDKLHNIIDQVKKNIQLVAQATSEMSATSAQLAAGAEEQKQQTGDVAVSMQQMTSVVTESSRSAQQTADISIQSQVKSQEGMAIMLQAENSVQQIVQASEKVGTLIAQLSDQAKEVADIVHMINDITEQTDILSINASVEAARLGESGKGFTVVADEMKLLSESTGNQTKIISGTIKNIQDQIQESVNAMTEMDTSVTQGKDAMEKSRTAFNEIATSISQVQVMMEQISTASEEQSATIRVISNNVTTINNVTQQTAAAAEQLSTASSHLADQSRTLSELVDKFKLMDEKKGV